jgi:ketosteroid isomerase-like protein
LALRPARATAIVTLVAGSPPLVAGARKLCGRLGHRKIRPNGDFPTMLKTMTALAVAGILGAAPALAAPAVADPAPVIAAERAFSARAAEAGVAQSFLDNMTDDAIVFAPDPVSAKSVYGGRPAEKTPKEGGPLLAWWPNFAGIARSGDLGFTTGPAESNGKRIVHYFTVWQRQTDGGWKWVYDGGAESDASRAPGPDAPVQAMPPGDASPLSPAIAMDQVRAAETALADRARTDVTSAYKIVLVADARMQGSPLAPATTPDEVAKELATRAKAIAFSPLGGGASKAGDLAWTYGDARWTGGRGHYVRIWQRRGGAWKIVFDQILPVAKS